MKHFILFIALLSLVSCKEDAPRPETALEANTLFAWQGKWSGPEGTYMILEQNGQGMGIRIKNLDEKKTFLGVIEGNHIKFERDGKDASIHAGTGADTGMKWLADKKDCMIVERGEGYCRD